MSKQIEERVVSMQFDNSRFEKNVETSMSTLDKLKQKLNLSGASKGLESVQTAAGKVNMSGLASSVDTVSSRFSALEVMGVTALANITNSAVNAGKRLISALTIDPIMDGFNEYEMTLNAVQTTMAGTGKTAEEVEKELKKLDDYADKTVYSSADMFNNLPKFTNAGVELETATKAMIGIANATALAGGGANQASIAFYNLGQSIGTGYLTRMDYNSINNAGIATMEWKNAMIEAAIAQGTLTKTGEDAYVAGGKTYTLQQLFIDGLQKQWATADVLIDVFGDYGDETTEIGKKAWSAAQDVKTFTMMMESLKATAGTGWKDTWQIIFGDLEGAKEFWTSLNNVISGVITKMADWRNMLLGGALNLGGVWDTITGKLENSPIGKVSKVVDTFKDASKGLEYFQEVVNKVWRGDYNNKGDNPDRYDLLEKAGYDHRVVQDLVNKGYKYQLTMEDVEASHKKFGLTMEQTSEQTEETAKSVNELTDEQLKNAGLTDEEISLYKALQKEADRLGVSIDDLVKSMSENDGRTLLIDSFKNVWSGISGIFKAIGHAWKEIFNPGGVGELSVKLYGLITSLNNFTKKLRMTDETSDKLKRTFKGLFAIIDIIATIVGGPIKIAFKILTKILGAFNLNILDVTAYIGDAIVRFHDWLDETLDFTGVIKKLTPYLEKAVKAIKEWFAGMKDTKVVKTVSEYTKSAANSVKEWFAALKDNGVLNTFVSYAKKAVEVMKEWFAALKETPLFKLLSSYVQTSGASIKEWFDGFKEAENIPRYIIQGLVNGLKSGIKMAASVVKELAITILDTIKSILGIHSPSTEFYEIGKNVVLGFFNGIKDFVTMIYDIVMSIGGKIIEIVKNFDVGSVITSFVGVGFTLGFLKIADAVDALTEPLEGVGDILKASAKVVKSFSKVLGSVGNWVNAQALKTVAISIAILVGSVALLCLLPVGKVWASIGAIAALAIILGALTVAIGEWGPSDGVQFGKIAGLLLSFAAAVLIFSIAFKIMSSITPDAMTQAIGALWHIVSSFAAILLAFSLLSNYSQGVSEAGETLIKLAIAMAIMALTVGLLGKMKQETLTKGLNTIAIFAAIIIVLMAAVKFFGEDAAGVGETLMQLAIAMAIMALTVGLLGKMKQETLTKGLNTIEIFAAIIIVLMAAVKFFGEDAAGVGKTLLLISVAIALLAGVAVLLGMVSEENLKKGIAAVAALAVLAGLLVIATRFAGEDCYKSMIGIAIAIGVMAAAVAVMTFLDPTKLVAATLCMSLLIRMLSLLVAATGKANGSIGVLIVITVAIALIGTILILLSRMPIANTIAAAVSLSLLLAVMTGVLWALNKMDVSIGSALKGVIGLLALCVPLVAIAGILCLMNCVNDAMTSALALSLLLGVMTVVLGILTIIGTFAVSAIAGVVALLALCVPLVAIAGILCLMNCVNDAMISALALSLLMQTMGDVCFKLALVGPLALVGVAAVYALTALMVAVGVMAVAIGALMEKCPALEGFIDKGLSIMIKLAGGIGEMIGAFLTAIAEAVMALLPKLGLSLSMFMVNLQPFLMGMKMVDGSIVKGVGIIVSAVLALLVAELINGIAKFFGVNFVDLAVELSAFMAAALPFILGLKLITPEMATAAENLAKLILAITIADVIQGIKSFLGLEGGLDSFGQKLASFGNSIKDFLASIEGLTEEDLKKVDLAAQAGAKMSEMANNLPRSGGIWQKIVGEQDMAAFGEKIVSYGEALVAFAGSVSTITPEQTTAIKSATEAGNALADLNNAIPKSGGWWQDIAGSQDLATFGEKIVAFGRSIIEYAGIVCNLPEGSTDYINASVDAGNALANLNNAIPKSGGWWQDIAGSKDIGTFGEKIVKFAQGLLDYAEVARGIDAETDVAAIENTKAVINKIKEVAELVPKSGGWWDGIAGSKDSGSFGEAIKSLAGGIKSYLACTNMITEDSVSKIEYSKNAITALQNVANEVPSNNDGIKNSKSFMDSMKTLIGNVKTYIDSARNITEDGITAINNSKSAVDAINSVATAMSGVNTETLTPAVDAVTSLSELISGMTLKNFSGATKFAEALSVIASTDVEGFKTTMSGLAESGLDGFMDSLTDGTAKAADAGKTLIKGVIDGVNSGLDGFTAAFTDGKAKAADAGKSLIKGMIDGINSGIPVLVCTVENIARHIKLVSLSFKIAGRMMMTNLRNGIESQAITIFKTITTIITACASTISLYYASFYDAGAFVATGFANGVKDNKSLATDAGSSLGKAALAAAKAALDENSPSKEMYKVGDYAGIGFVNALYDNVSNAYKAGTKVADSAKVGISDAVARIADIVNSDIDAQPTIRPVLDLSDVRAGAGSINALFSGRTLAVDMAGVGAVSTSMAGFQNGSDSKEIVSSIKALRKDIADMPRNTYTVNGVTYDDGSNVSNTVGELVRAIKIEKRT